MGIWTKNNKLIIDSNGHPISCSHCPCVPPVPVECSEAVDIEVQNYLDIIDPDTQQHVWTLYGTYEANYTCAEWSYDTELQEWTLVHPADGYLLVALRKGQIVTDTTNCYEEKLVYAKTIYKAATGEYKTIGCQCRISDHECKHRKTVLDDYLIAGELHVKPYDESDSGASYAPSDACEVDTCELLKLKLETAQYWHGGTLMGEGYYDWLLVPHDYSTYDHEPFKMALKWEVEMSYSDSESHDPIYNLTFINCDCTSITTHTLQQGESCLEYAGICDTEHPCLVMMKLHLEAEENGWIWHGEGVLVHLAEIVVGGTTYYGDWYEIRKTNGDSSYADDYAEFRRRMCCAETPTEYRVISCECEVVGIYEKDENGISGYWKWLDLEGVCACTNIDGSSPTRELLLAYPEEFGVQDVKWGNDWIFEAVHGTDEYGDVCGARVDASGGTHGGQVNDQTYTVRIDYRALCVIRKAFKSDGTEGVSVRVYYPDNSAQASYSYDWWTATAHYRVFDSASFTGRAIPFAHNSNIYRHQGVGIQEDGWDFKGLNYVWTGGGGGEHEWFNCCEPAWTGDEWTQRNAEEEAGCSYTLNPCMSWSGNGGIYWQGQALLTPDWTLTEHACQTRQKSNGRWEYKHKWWTWGVNMGSCNAWANYHVQWCETNEGFIVKGMSGKQASFTILGARNLDPSLIWCYQREDPDYLPDDETKTCVIDTDMHWCVDLGIEWDSDSEVSDSSSLSESVSGSESTSVSEGE